MSGIGFGSSLIAAFDHNMFMVWIGAGVSGFGFIMTTILNSYHKFREVRRSEDEADRRSEEQANVLMMMRQRELEMRVSKTEQDAVELAARLECIKCVFPNADGSARCRGLESPT
jgi:hypothetical protein